MKHLYILVFFISFFTNSSIAQWVTKPSGTSQHLLAVSFADSAVGFASGYVGTILKTVDAGETWAAQTSGTTSELYAINFVTTNVGYAAGNNGVIVKTINGGSTWNTLQTGSSVDFRELHFLNADSGFAVGVSSGGSGSIYKTANGGTSWTVAASPSNALYAVYFTNNSIGYVVGQGGTIMKTTDGGINWISQTSPTSFYLLDVYFTNDSTGYISGENGIILKTVDAGITWTSLSSGSTTDYLTSIKFADSNLGYAVGGNVNNNTSSVFKTNDAGVTWTVDSTSVYRLYDIDYVSNHSAVIVGLNGTIIKNDDVPTVINNISIEGFSVYPNPFSSEIFIKIKAGSSIELFDALGKKLDVEFNFENETATINASSLSTGIYFLRVIYNGESQIKKLIKS